MGLFDRFRRPSPGSAGPAAVRARLEGAMAKRRLRGWNPPLENINALVASGGLVYGIAVLATGAFRPSEVRQLLRRSPKA